MGNTDEERKQELRSMTDEELVVQCDAGFKDALHELSHRAISRKAALIEIDRRSRERRKGERRRP